MAVRALPLLLLAGCSLFDVGGEAAAPAPLIPATARMHRLTEVQYRNAVRDLVGVEWAGDLPGDYVLYGYSTVGSAEVTLAPSELELVETAAWAVAQAAIPTDADRDAFVGCPLGVPLGGPAAWGEDDLACVEGFVTRFGRDAWRRPLDGEEIAAMVALYEEVRAAGDDATLGVQALVAAFLLAPDFLYRVEVGEPDPAGGRRLTSWELATRLSFFLTDSTPDEALLIAAESGALATEAGLRAQVERLVATPAAREAMTRFFDETMDLYKLDLVAKDATLFPEWTEAARAAAREEVRRIFQDLVLDQGAGVDELFTTDLAYVNGDLAPLYDLDITGAELRAVRLPPEAERGGILGRAAFLAINANATFNSPTHRGKWVRTRILCQDIPPPPAGIPTLDQTPQETTLRARLEQHVADPSCAGCHRLMDPIGFGFEHFDPVGAWQSLDNGYPIDATGEIDGIVFDGAAGVGAAVAAHPDLAECFARNLYRWAKGELETEGEEGEIVGLGASFAASGMAFGELVAAVALSDGFRRVEAPASATCTEAEAGRTRPCETDCGRGEETCRDGWWSGCTAEAPAPEDCDGLDNDCDGTADEAVTRACDAAFGPGVQRCLSAQWQACEGPAAPLETCDGADQDGDGAVDEDLAVHLLTRTWAELAAAHPACDPSVDAATDTCHSAAHRTCAAAGCWSAGQGIVAVDPSTSEAAIACLDATQAVPLSTSYTELAAWHGGCTEAAPYGPDCNAAIHRYCAAVGLGTGYGPVEHAGDYAAVVCTPGATAVVTGYSVLVGHDGGCDGSSQRMGDDCDAAMHRFCQEQGWLTGFGPLENSGDTAYVACLGGA